MIRHFKLQAQNVIGSWDEAGSPSTLVYAIGLKRRSLFCLSSKKESRNLLCFLPLRLSQSEKNSLAEIRLSVAGSRQDHLWLEKNPPPHSFFHFETRLYNIII